MKYGFVKVATAIPAVRVADCVFNAQQIKDQITEASIEGVELITFPELSITGYTCADLFGQTILLEESEKALYEICQHMQGMELVAVVGMPILHNNTLLNCAIVIYKGEIKGVVPKTYLPNYSEFYEQRWFTSATAHASITVSLCGQQVPMNVNSIFKMPQLSFGIELCEDVWAPIPPSSLLALKGADLIVNLSGSNESIGKHHYLRSLLSQQSARCIAGYIYSSCGFGESTTDLVFAGNGLIFENGALLAHSKRFYLEPQLITSEIDIERIRNERQKNTTFAASIASAKEQPSFVVEIDTARNSSDKLTRMVDPHPFVPKGKELELRCEEILSIQVAGLAKRLVHTHSKTVVVGISGGLDSTLALLVCVETFDKLNLPRKGIVGITMPGFGTTDRTYQNAISMMNSLGITIREISIREACIQHFKDIDHDINVHNVTYENGQARERTQILMNVANQVGGLVIGTGDLSELALGWATYNGDHMSMYGVNGSIPKTLVKYLVTWIANNHMNEESRATLLDVVDTPISPELIPADEQGNIKQKTEDLVGPYELHDFFLYYFLRFGFRPKKIYFLAQQAFGSNYDKDTLKKWLTTFCRRFFQQQFKRSCLPDGPKVGSVTLSPRGDWRMPSDASAALWIAECEALEV
ncbi:MAG: NAD(+) synthase [Phocaeicola sp.]